MHQINYLIYFILHLTMNIFVAGLSYQITEADLRELFEEYGEVSSAKIVTDRETRRSKGYGFVEMANDEEANRAIAELNEAEYDGRRLSVSEARPRPEGGDRPPRNNNYGHNRGGGGGYGHRERSNRY